MRLLRWLVRLEIGIWRSLFLWTFRRVPGMHPGAAAFSYSRQVAPVIAAFIFVSLVELPVVHLLIPWDAVRLVVLILSVWGLLWMVGMLASVKVFPHLLDDAGLRIRYGTQVDLFVPWESVERVVARRGSVDTQRHLHVEDGVASVPVMKMTRADVELRRPLSVAGREVTKLRLYADDPRALVERAAEERLDRHPRRLVRERAEP
jgi:hypothetical protein